MVSRRAVIGVFGGSFDPPHLGHALLPTYLQSRRLVDRLVVAPTADHPFGAAVPGAPATKKNNPFPLRLSWIRAAMEPHGAFVDVTDLEARLLAEHGGPSYTIRLLDEVQRRHGDARVRLVIGSDIVRRGETARWHRWEEIASRFDPIVVPRVGYGDPGECSLPEVSSTQVREAVAAGRWTDLETLVPAAVLEQLRRPCPGTIWLVGHGHVAAHAEPWLRAGGWNVVSLPGRAVAAAVRELAAAARDLAAVQRPAWPAAIWLLVSDPALPPVAQNLHEIAREVGLPRSCVVLHAAGARRAHDVLGSLTDHPVGTLHPICSLRRERVWPSWLPRAGFGIEGDEPARAQAIALVGDQPWLDLQGLDATERRAYHAACALTANHLAVLWESSAEVLRAQGQPASLSRGILASLLRSSIDNLLGLGIPSGITGPVSRGDAETVKAHVAALEGDAAELYRVLSERLAHIVETSAAVTGEPDESP